MEDSISSRKLAVKILDQIFKNNAYSNIAVSQNLNKYKLNDLDKALVTEIVYGTLKYKYSIDKILSNFISMPLNKLELSVLNILRISIYQIKYLDKIPSFAAVNEAVNLGKYFSSIGASKMINGVLRNFIRNIDKVYYNTADSIDKLCFEYSVEPWMAKLFIKQYGLTTCEFILKGLNSVPCVTVRVNSFRTNKAQIVEELIENGYNVEVETVPKNGVRIIKGRSIEQNKLFTSGLCTVQDESAMLVAEIMELSSGMRVLDMCAAPGGKTTHIAELLGNTGKVEAFDKYEAKLKLVEENAKRLGLTNITTALQDAEEFNSKLTDMYDRVLLDVPCSGLGIIRKKPEIKWNKDYNQLKSILSTQRQILNNSSKYVKKDGLLIYSTCTLNIDENDGIINEFLKNNPSFKLEMIDIKPSSNIVINSTGTLTVLPNEDMDGFYIAKLKRQW